MLQPEEANNHHKRLSNPFVPATRPVTDALNVEPKVRQSEHRKNDVLDQQVANFNLKAKLQQHRKTPTDLNLRQRRAYTDHIGAE